MLKNMIELKVKHTRPGLMEGRSQGLGFGFVKKLDNKNFETVMPISPCKDYLNDVVYQQNTTSPEKTIYGFTYGKQEDLYTKNYGYIAIRIQPSNKNSKELDYAGSDKDFKALNENYKNLKTFLNYFEKVLPIRYKSSVVKSTDEHYILKVPKFWLQECYLISLYSALVRAGIYYSDTTMSPMDFLEKKKYKPNDIGIWGSALPRFKKILKDPENIPHENYDAATDISDVHNHGIVNTKTGL